MPSLRAKRSNPYSLPSKEAGEKRPKGIIDIALKKGELVWFDGHWQIIKEDSTWSTHIFDFDDDEAIFQFSKDRLLEAVNKSLNQELGKNGTDTHDDFDREMVRRCETILFSYSYRHKRWQLLSTRNDCGIFKAALIKLKLFFYPTEPTKDEISFWIMMSYFFIISCISFWLTLEDGISPENKFVLLANKINSRC